MARKGKVEIDDSKGRKLLVLNAGETVSELNKEIRQKNKKEGQKIRAGHFVATNGKPKAKAKAKAKTKEKKPVPVSAGKEKLTGIQRAELAWKTRDKSKDRLANQELYDEALAGKAKAKKQSYADHESDSEDDDDDYVPDADADADADE